MTVEFENVSAPALRWLERRVPVRPGWKTVWVSQNRLREKTFLARHGLPLAPWRPVRTDAELAQAVEALGLPLILKTAASGYDGKGQVRVDDPAHAESAWNQLGRVACVAEGWVTFASEVSVVVARGADGEAVTFPVAFNRHERHILDSTVMPAPVGPIVSQDARDLALSVAQALGTVGVLTVEFFLTAEGQLAHQRAGPSSAQLGASDDRGGRDRASSSSRSAPSAGSRWAGRTSSRPPRWSTCSATSGTTASPTGPA